MTSRTELRLRAFLWFVFALLAVGGLGVLSLPMLAPQAPVPYLLPEVRQAPVQDANGNTVEQLAKRRMSRQLTGPAAPPAAVSIPASVPIESLIKLTGVLDFGGKQPSLAVIEMVGTNESKTFKSGDKVGETGVVIKDIKDFVIVEYDKRRFKMTFSGVQEVPANSVGAKTQ